MRDFEFKKMLCNQKRAVLSLGIALAAAAANAQLVSDWSFNSTLNDSVGTNNGTWNGTGSPTYGPGAFGQALSLTGNGDVDVANPIAGGLQLVNGFTVTSWIDMSSESTGAGTGSIMNLRTAANNSGFSLEELSLNPNTLVLAVNTSGATNGFDEVSSGGWNFGQSYFVAASFDAASHTMKLYRDGVLIAADNSVSGTSMIANAASDFQIGGNIVNGSLWNGYIEDSRLYNGALSDSQIQDLYNAAPEPSPILITLATVGLLANRRRRAARRR
jgi:hypothetical protein